MQIILKHNNLSLGILPECGGSLSFFKINDTDILRPCPETETDANNTAMFVMLPYASFIREGHFPYFGITRTVPVNSKLAKVPMHGDVWCHKTQILSQSENNVVLLYRHNKADGFPFNYEAQIKYQLNETGLHIALTLTNLSALPMPYGMGVHPFIQKQSQMQLSYTANSVWFHDNDPIEGHPYPIPPALDYQKFRDAPKSINLSVGGWNGTATIKSPKFTFTITGDNTFRHLTVYAQRGKDFLCVEPVSHTPNAFNLAANGTIGTGIQSLGPKETISNTIDFNVKG